MTSRVAAIAAASLFACLLLSQCRLLQQKPPFQYLPTVLVVGPAEGCHELIGLHYGVRNLGDISITGLHLSFRLYDETSGPLPAPGENRFDIDYSGEVPPHGEAVICACLDSSFYFQPSGEPIVEEFRISYAKLADGGEWADPFGLFRYPYDVELCSTAGGE